MNPMVIYVAGPYSKGDVALNVKEAMNIGIKIADLGHYPVIPHLTHFLHMMYPREYNYWIKLDNIIIPKCNALYRISGESSGADDEVVLARFYDLPVFFNFDELTRYIKNLYI